MLKHYRGNKNKYKYDVSNPDSQQHVLDHKDGIYFAKDTHEILVNGNSYSGSTYKEIEISGGPLASHITSTAGNNWPSDWKKDGKKIIPAGKSLQEILTTLLLKEFWPETVPSVIPGSFNIAVGSPSISSAPSGVKEVGSEVTVNAMTTGSITTPSTSTRFDGGFTYGYYDPATSTKNTTDGSCPTSKSVTNIVLSIPKNPEDNTKNAAYLNMYVDVTNIDGVTLNDPTNYTLQEVKVSDVDKVRIIPNTMPATSTSSIPGVCGFKFKVKEGSNSVSYGFRPCNGITATGNIPGMGSYTALSSLDNISDNLDLTTEDVDAENNKTVSLSNTSDKTNSFSCTGVYPIYTNGKVLTSNSDFTANANKAYGTDGPSGRDRLTLKLYSEYRTLYFGFGSPADSVGKWTIYIPVSSNLTISDSSGYNPNNNTWSSKADWTLEKIVYINVNNGAQGVAYNKYISSGAGAENTVKLTFK